MDKVRICCGAILLDMDGTLVDSTMCVERQWARFAKRHELDYEKIMAVSHGRPNAETIREVAPHLAIQAVFDNFDKEEMLDREGIEAVCGAAAFVRALIPGKWAIVTSASRALAEMRLACAGLPIPEVLISADDITYGKPHPEGYILASQRLGIAPPDCLVFEDTPAGLEAAHCAGMQSIGIATTFASEQLRCGFCIKDFSTIQVSRQGKQTDLRGNYVIELT